MSTMRSAFYRWLGSYCDWRVRCRAARDARRNIPLWDAQEQPPFLNSLVSAVRQSLRLHLEAWHKLDSRLKSEWLGCRKERALAETQFKLACDKAKNARQLYASVHGHEPTVVRSAWRHVGYFVLLLILAVFELPINSFVFRGLHEAAAMTWLFAFVIGIVLMLAAHFLGTLLRQTKKTKSASILTGILSAFVPVLIFGVGYLRASYLQRISSTDSQFNPTVVGAIFFALNVLLFVGATVAAYAHHEAFAGEVTKTEHARRRAERLLAHASKELASAHTNRDKRFESAKEQANAIAEEVSRLTGIYWSKNLERRRDHEQHTAGYPVAFTRSVSLRIPEQFETLEWKIPGEKEASIGSARPETEEMEDSILRELNPTATRP